MTIAAAFQTFFESFGIPAFERYSVPDDAEYPYITYDYATASWSDGETSLTVDIWYQGEGNAAINAKAHELSERIGMGGVLLRCDDGAVWLKRGSPFCQALSDPGDDTIKRRYINISAEFLTA